MNLLALILAGCTVGTPAPDAAPVDVGIETVSASAEDGEHVAANTVDGDPDTRWSAEGRANGDAAAGPWIAWQLDDAYDLHEIELAFYEGANGNPTSFHVEVSEDGQAWTRVLTTTASGASDDPESFSFEAHRASHVRYVGEGRRTSAWNSITMVDLEAARTADQDERAGPDPGASGAGGSAVSHGAELRETDVGLTPAGDLRPSGPVTTTHDGQVVSGLDIVAEGRDEVAVTVRHDDVVVRQNRIRFPDGAGGVDIEPEARGARIEHNVLDAVRLSDVRKGTTSSNNNIGQRGMHVRGPDALVRRNHLVYVRSGIRVTGDGARVEENLVARLADASEDSADGGSLHGTSVSVPGDVQDVVVARNLLRAGQSGGVVLYAQGGPLRDVRVLDNHIVGDGRGFGIYGGRTHPEQGHVEDNEGIRIEGNRFQGTFGFDDVVGEGTNTAVDLAREGSTFEDNRWIADNQDLQARCGITQDDCEEP
jgi:hypothetical protein